MKRHYLVAVCAILVFVLFIIFKVPDFNDSGSGQPIEKGPDARPAEWAMLQRTFPYYDADWNHRHKIIAAVREKRALAKTGVGPQWQLAGPTNIGGRIVDIEFDPGNPNVVYAGAATGGVFKSYDTGVTWQPIFDEQAVLTVGDICVDPVNPDIIYVGTGEANGGHNNFPGGGVYKSTDGGTTWSLTGLELAASIGRILVDPQNHERVVVAAVGSYFAPNPDRGVYISPDGGATWGKSLFVSDSAGAIDLVMDPANPDFMMAALWERVRRPVYNSGTHLSGPASGIYRTNDGGVRWEKLGALSGLPDSYSANVGRIGLAMFPQDSRIIYALFTDGFNISGLYRTDDSGNTWIDADPDDELQNGDAGFSWYFGQVRVHPTDPEIVYVMDVNFMRSKDGGSTWPLRYGYSGPSNLHVDHHALAFMPQNPDYIINGNDGGINISTDGGGAWSKIAHLPVTQFYEVGIDATYPERLFGGTQDNGSIGTFSGNTADWQFLNGGDGFYVIVDHQNPDIIYTESQFGALVKITNNGTSVRSVTNGINSNDKRNWSTPVAMDPNNPLILYYGTNRLYRTENGAESWYTISGDLSRQLPDEKIGTITTIAVASSDLEVIYLGTDDGLVWVSRDFGANWTNISAGLPFRWVTRVVIHPDSANIAYVTFSGLRWKDAQPHIFRTASFGASWENITGNLPEAPVNAFAIDPRNPSILYTGTDLGAYVSFETGHNWSLLGEGLPLVVIGDLKVIDSTYTLVAGTYGRSMYTINLEEVTGIRTDKIETNLPEQFVLNQNYPNPFNAETIIRYALPEAGHTELSVYDILGRKITTLVSGKQMAGEFAVRWQPGEVASGVYLCRLFAQTTDGSVMTQMRRMILIK